MPHTPQPSQVRSEADGSWTATLTLGGEVIARIPGLPTRAAAEALVEDFLEESL